MKYAVTFTRRIGKRWDFRYKEVEAKRGDVNKLFLGVLSQYQKRIDDVKSITFERHNTLSYGLDYTGIYIRFKNGNSLFIVIDGVL